MKRATTNKHDVETLWCTTHVERVPETCVFLVFAFSRFVGFSGFLAVFCFFWVLVCFVVCF